MIVLCVMGRDRLFAWAARRLDRNATRRAQDGAFVASLLDQVELVVGQTWWVHREAGDQDATYPEGDHRRDWREGYVVEVGTLDFGVELCACTRRSLQGTRGSQKSQPSDVCFLPLAARNMSSKQLFEEAHQGLRCILAIAWANFKTLFSNNIETR